MGKKAKTETESNGAAAAGAEKKEKKEKLSYPEEPAKPDQDKFQNEKKVLEDEIEKLKKELDVHTAHINKKTEGKEEYENQKKVLQQDFHKAKEAFDELRASQQECLSQLKRQNESRRENNRALNDLQKTVDSLGEEGIDRRIKELEFKMHTQSLKLSEEKMIIKEIQELKRKRPEMQKMDQKIEELKQSKEMSELSKKPLEEQLTEIRAKIDTARQIKDERNKVLNELRDSRKDQREAIQGLIAKKEEVKSKINDRRDAIRALRDAYKKEEKLHRDWEYKCREIRRAHKDAMWAKECEAWEAEQKKQELANANEKPYFEEMMLLEQTITYCQGLMPEEKKDEEVAAKTADDYDAPEKYSVLLSKKDREAEFFHAPAKKGPKGKKRNPEKKNQSNIKHNAGTIQLFSKLEVKAPMTVEEVPESIATLQKALAVYEKKIEEWQEKRKALEEEVRQADEKAKADESA